MVKKGTTFRAEQKLVTIYFTRVMTVASMLKNQELMELQSAPAFPFFQF